MKFKHYFMEDALEDIIDYRGKTPHKATSGIPTLSAKSVKDGYIDYSNCYFISLEEYYRFMVRGIPKTGDVLLTTEAPLGNVARLDKEDIALAQRVLALRGKQGVLDTGFLYYYLRSPIGQAKLIEKETGTTVTGIKQSEFRRIEIDIPSYAVQKKIVDILGHLDQKIRLNRKINKNLQEQAVAIYNRLFHVEAENPWPSGVLSDIADITMGQSPKSDTYNEEGIGTVFFQGRAEFGFRFPTRRLYTIDPRRMAHVNDVLMSVRAPVGDINVAYEDCCIGRGLSAIHSNDGHQSYILYTMIDLQKQLDIYNGEGTVFGSINRDALKSIKVALPPRDLVDQFEEIVLPIDSAIRVNYDENCQLESIRDILLPRLMSGEINTSNIYL
jgi:type I restriction enzyme S subunit